MKKIVLIFISVIMLFLLVGCDTVDENGVPSYFLEPDGYIIAEVDLKDSGLFSSSSYGYISNEDYQKYTNGELNGVLIIKHPYENDKEVSVNSTEIRQIIIGEYEDYCHY